MFCVLALASPALTKPQNFDFNSLADAGNAFVVKAQPVAEGSANTPVPAFSNLPGAGAAALLAGNPSKLLLQRLRHHFPQCIFFSETTVTSKDFVAFMFSVEHRTLPQHLFYKVTYFSYFPSGKLDKT